LNIKARRKKNNSSRDEIHENSRIHLDRSWNKYRDCKGIKQNPSFGQNARQEKLDN
jgi:hypothetical protein